MKTTDFHHRFPESLGGTRHPDNLYLINVIRHRAYHILNDNRTPMQVTLQHFREFVEKIMKPEVYEMISKPVLEVIKDEKYAYKNGILVPSKFDQSLKKYDNQKQYRLGQ